MQRLSYQEEVCTTLLYRVAFFSQSIHFMRRTFANYLLFAPVANIHLRIFKHTRTRTHTHNQTRVFLFSLEYFLRCLTNTIGFRLKYNDHHASSCCSAAVCLSSYLIALTDLICALLGGLLNINIETPRYTTDKMFIMYKSKEVEFLV